MKTESRSFWVSTLKSSSRRRGRSLAWPRSLLRRPVHGACAPGLGDYLPHVPGSRERENTSRDHVRGLGHRRANAGSTTSSTPTTS